MRMKILAGRPRRWCGRGAVLLPVLLSGSWPSRQRQQLESYEFSRVVIMDIDAGRSGSKATRRDMKATDEDYYADRDVEDDRLDVLGGGGGYVPAEQIVDNAHDRCARWIGSASLTTRTDVEGVEARGVAQGRGRGVRRSATEESKVLSLVAERQDEGKESRRRFFFEAEKTVRNDVSVILKLNLFEHAAGRRRTASTAAGSFVVGAIDKNLFASEIVSAGPPNIGRLFRCMQDLSVIVILPLADC